MYHGSWSLINPVMVLARRCCAHCTRSSEQREQAALRLPFFFISVARFEHIIHTPCALRISLRLRAYTLLYALECASDIYRLTSVWHRANLRPLPSSP